MRLTRRHLLVAGLSVPVLFVARQGASVVGEAIGGAARAARPGANGTSATRCAQCGSPDHTMLDPRCPLTPRVRA